jgi:hypothetical protein
MAARPCGVAKPRKASDPIRQPLRRIVFSEDDGRLALHSLELHTLQFGGSSIPRILPNTLHTLKIHGAIVLEPSTLRDVFESQSRTLRHLEIVDCRHHGIRNWSAVLSSAGQLSYLRFSRNQSQDSLEPMLLPTSLNDLFIDWRKRTPELALSFLQRQATRSFSGHVRSFEFRGVKGGDAWEIVKGTGESLGIRVTIGGLVKRLESNPVKLRMQHMSIQ